MGGDTKGMMSSPSRSTRRHATLRVSVGISLIAGSLLASFVVLESRGETHTVIITASALVAGEPVTGADLSRVQVPQSTLWDDYLSEGDEQSVDGLVASRSLDPNEPLRARDFQEPSTLDDTVITIPLSIGSPSWLHRGAAVEIWVAPPASENSFSAPFIPSPRDRTRSRMPSSA